jgi:dihydrofolate reductase
MIEIIIIAALSENNVIGKSGDIPWRIKEDFKRFKEMTTGHPCIMGDKTYESLPENARPLPGRENIVLTFNKEYRPNGTTVFYSFDDAINYCKQRKYQKVFICGGASIYRIGLPVADTLELTRIHKNIEGDTFFPQIDFNAWDLEKKEDRVDTTVGNYSFITYKRKKNVNL